MDYNIYKKNDMIDLIKILAEKFNIIIDTESAKKLEKSTLIMVYEDMESEEKYQKNPDMENILKLYEIDFNQLED